MNEENEENVPDQNNDIQDEIDGMINDINRSDTDELLAKIKSGDASDLIQFISTNSQRIIDLHNMDIGEFKSYK